jgi:L-alanine-DL-glutamate epimerase-like enolase superfamily enzyme
MTDSWVMAAMMRREPRQQNGQVAIHTLAELHTAAVSTNLLEACECVGPLKMTGDVVTEPIQMPRGEEPVLQGPGLGATLDEAQLAQHAVPIPT